MQLTEQVVPAGKMGVVIDADGNRLYSFPAGEAVPPLEVPDGCRLEMFDVEMVGPRQMRGWTYERMTVWEKLEALCRLLGISKVDIEREYAAYVNAVKAAGLYATPYMDARRLNLEADRCQANHTAIKARLAGEIIGRPWHPWMNSPDKPDEPFRMNDEQVPDYEARQAVSDQKAVDRGLLPRGTAAEGPET